MNEEKKTAQKTVVIGLDGATFEFINPWIENGELPIFKKIREKGVSADMKSCLPPVTIPNWKCYSTGKNPGKLGIFWWENIDIKKEKIYFPSHRIYESKEIWDYLSDKRKKVCVLNVPATYPPKRVNGFMISGGPDAKDRNFTYPPDLGEKLKKNYDYKVHPELFFIKKDRKVVEEILTMIESRFKVAKDFLLKEDLDFLHITIFYINVLQHFFGAGDYTKRGWKIIDKNIGELLEKLNNDCNIIIMSDHGSNKIKQVFNINAWLEKEGYLKLKNMKLFSTINKLGINQEKLSKILSILRIKKRVLLEIIPNQILNYIPNEEGKFNKTFKADKIDWKKTKVLASGQGPIYINLNNSKEYGKLRNELIEKLESLKNPSTGEKIVEKVYKKEEIYNGKYIEEAPDLIVDQAYGTHISGGISNNYFFHLPKKWEAENKKIGMFIAYGPDIKKGEKIENVSILDLAPTILHMMNMCVPRDMDGRVLKEIFRPHSEPGRRRVIYLDEKEKIGARVLKEEEPFTKEDEEKVKERLRRLGYL